ncbi:Sodium/glucose cotransporter 4 [Holothuria leucospilota]|uniref:Sodium/glucose cotransporter 4 n=1 Tax=Holothuria leucospilota TaxID=206669 RepID=A0A9Q1BTD9_HOLLE|nr:Sodium/glucose cotransporter 4 [Holothuria leucospilota]
MTSYPNETIYGNNTCGYPREDSFQMLRAPRGSDLPWPGFIFGQTTASLWYWCSDQVIVQRALSAKNLSHGKGGTLFAGLCKITPLFFIVLPGMISRILYPDEVACVDPAVCEEVCGSTAGCSNLAYPMLVMNVLPTGPRGLMLAVMLSALTSSLTSIFNSGSTIFTMDIWRKLRKFPPDAEMAKLSSKEKRRYNMELMIVGRVFVLILIGISIVWIPVVQNSQGGQLFHYIQEISAYLSPPIAAIFLIAVLWERLTEPAAFWSLMCGLAVGLTRMCLDFIYESPACGEEDHRPSAVAALQFHYMYFALVLFLFTAVLSIIFSYMSRPIPSEYLYRLTFWSRHNKRDRLDVDEFYGNVTPGKNVGKAEEIELKGNGNIETERKEKNAETSDVSFLPMERTEQPSYNQPQEKSFMRKLYDGFCGFSDEDNQVPTEDEKRVQEREMMDKIEQSKTENIILNIGLVCVLSIGTFLLGWFA